MTYLRAGLIAGLVSLSGGAFAQNLTVETGTASGTTTMVMQVIATYGDLDLQINSGQTLTRACLKLGQGAIDAAVCPPPAFRAMSNGVGPYRQDPDAAKAAAENVRSLFGFSGGVFHPMIRPDGPIESWDDLMGARIFTGPPSGSANAQAQTLILAASGLEANVDYEAVQVGWGAALQAFQDGQFDMFMFPTAAGNNQVEQLGPITLLSMDDEAQQSEAWQQWSRDDSRQAGAIPAGTYANATNGEDVVAAEYFMMSAVNVNMEDEAAYQMTRQFWENLAQATGDIRILESIDSSAPLTGLNAPLHPGAIRYYEEIGIEIPDNLR